MTDEKGSDAPSIYNEYAPQAINNGFFTVPAVGKIPHRFDEDRQELIKFPEWTKTTCPIDPARLPQPGAGISVRMGYVIGMDVDSDEANEKIRGAFEPSPINKRGQRGYTALLRRPNGKEVRTENFYDTDGKLVVQILAKGSHSSMPPTIHPDTNEPYQFLSEQTIYNTQVMALPILPDDYRERMIALGYSPDNAPKKRQETVDPETGEIRESDPHDDWRAVNDAALQNLKAWVPHLGLYGLKQTGFRYVGYRSVASYRPSLSDLPLEQRHLHLYIAGKGITDYGLNVGLTAIDLVMKCHNCSNGEARRWLEEKLQPPNEFKVDFDAILGSAENAKPADGADDADARRNRLRSRNCSADLAQYGNSATPCQPALRCWCHSSSRTCQCLATSTARLARSRRSSPMTC